jgi:hemoglobin
MLLSACATSSPRTSLYDSLGGEPGVARLVDQMIRNIAADERTRPYFRGIHIAGFRARLETHLCDIADGPCEWQGRSMYDAHRELDIESAAFNGLVENLIDAMDSEAIPLATQNRLLARLAPMYNDVVVR